MTKARREDPGRPRPSTDSMASTPIGRWAERHAPLIDGVVAALLFL